MWCNVCGVEPAGYVTCNSTGGHFLHCQIHKVVQTTIYRNNGKYVISVRIEVKIQCTCYVEIKQN